MITTELRARYLDAQAARDTTAAEQARLAHSLRQIEADIVSAREQLKSASTQKDIAAAQTKHRDLRIEHDSVTVRLEGAAERTAEADHALAAARIDLHGAAAKIATERCRATEAEALEIARQLGRLVRLRLQLARAAQVHATSAAGGRLVDPCGGTYPGERTPFSHALTELLEPHTGPVPVIELEDLLQWDAPAAAAAE
jgi:hypothetical protein